MERTCALDSKGPGVRTQLCRMTQLRAFPQLLVLASKVLHSRKLSAPQEVIFPGQIKTFDAKSVTLNGFKSLGYILYLSEPQFSLI